MEITLKKGLSSVRKMINEKVQLISFPILRIKAFFRYRIATEKKVIIATNTVVF